MPNRQPLSRVLIATGSGLFDVSALAGQFPEIVFDQAEPDETATKISDADAALIWGFSSDDLLENAARLKWIQTVGAGVERMLEGTFADRGILLTNGSGVMAPNMAEHVIGMMLAFARGLPTVLAAQRDRRWKSGVGMETVFELGGQTVVLVGLGNIALEIAARLKAFDMRVVGVRRVASPDDTFPNVDTVVSIAEIDSVLGEGDHVVSSVPHTAETVGMFNKARFSRFKDGARFYNVGRGTSVIQADLIAALESGRLAGAGLDVTAPEPLPDSDPLWDAPNVIITGHTAGATPRFHDRVLALFAENIRRYQAGDELVNVVDVARGY